MRHLLLGGAGVRRTNHHPQTKAIPRALAMKP